MLKPKKQIWKQKPTLFFLIFDKIINSLLFQLSFYLQLLVHGFRLYHVSHRKFLFSSWNIEHNFIKNSISNTNMFMFVFASFVNYLRSISRNLNLSKLKKEAVNLIFRIIKGNLNALLLEQWTGPPDMFTCNDYVMRASHATELFVTCL